MLQADETDLSVWSAAGKYKVAGFAFRRPLVFAFQIDVVVDLLTLKGIRSVSAHELITDPRYVFHCMKVMYVFPVNI